MGFFNNNSVIVLIQRLFRRPADAAMWLFTGMIVVGTLYTMLGTGPQPKRGRGR
ncbi:LAME_0A01618g1_1 [Lachancea meyersii CBS 8951]|uniref:LAME_0A01618g1_1 n=1 Tax=Lachancea meyersii CBS 8951 TaxID=1266667 RepID=A0A1G4IMH6_9SACH|nr:LAME_0A01618g1_1 [Lachancea meyersii CBS 8951]